MGALGLKVGRESAGIKGALSRRVVTHVYDGREKGRSNKWMEGIGGEEERGS